MRAVLIVFVMVVIGLAAWIWIRDEPDVLLVGDSIMRQTGPSLTDELSGYEVDNRGVNGSGLLNPAVYDWVDRLPGLVAQTQPEATVVLFIGNYAPEDEWWVGPDGEPVRPNTSGFFSEWRDQAERIVDILELSDTDIYWVLPPPVASPSGNETIAGLRDVYRQLAVDHPEITLVDASPSLTGGTGEFQWSIIDADGTETQLRAGDGVHLAEGGAGLLAEEIAVAIDAERS